MKTYPLYLNGKFVETKATIPVRNPATGEIFAQMSSCGRETVAKAIEDAHAAFGSWRNVVGRTRGDTLFKLAAELEKRKDDMARILTQENGKPLPQSHGEIGMTIDHVRWYAEEARRGYGRIIPHQADGKRHLAIKTPIGVVAAISPWNFPIVLGVRKVAPALAAGCTAILKPASATPLCSVIFAECVHAAGFPPGTFQLVAGKASDIAEEFLDNPHCRKISFTGSTEVGKQLIVGAARQVKPLSLELGGCGPVVIFDDCDLNKAVDVTILAKYRNTGQSCIAANRVFVQRGIYDRFVQMLVDKVKALKIGNGMDAGVEIGPLINEQALEGALRQVEDALSKGARLLTGGKRAKGLAGAFLEPTVLADVPDTSLCMREETFAPIAPISPFDTEDEAITRANSTPYGLCAYACTRDISRTFRLMESLEAGMIAINDGLPTTTQCPFGGVKQSGWGRELSIEGMEAFLETKHISFSIT